MLRGTSSGELAAAPAGPLAGGDVPETAPRDGERRRTLAPRLFQRLSLSLGAGASPGTLPHSGGKGGPLPDKRSMNPARPPPAEAGPTASGPAAGTTEAPRSEPRETVALDDAVYQIGECVGAGHSAKVFRALNAATGAVVAIKRIRKDALATGDLERFQDEIALLRLLSHPNIVQYRGCAESAARLDVVMEFCEGGSLQRQYTSFGPLGEPLVVSHVRQVLLGLQYLHSQGIIHRDVKAANILVTKDGQAKLSDFGIAIAGYRPSRSRAAGRDDFAGSAYWIAPELVLLMEATPAIDIWSVGCLTLELLQGAPPFAHLPPISALFYMVHDDHPPFPAGVSARLESFLFQCFHKDPRMRATCERLLSHLAGGEDPAAGSWSQRSERSASVSSKRSSAGVFLGLAPPLTPPQHLAGGPGGAEDEVSGLVIDDAFESKVQRLVQAGMGSSGARPVSAAAGASPRRLLGSTRSALLVGAGDVLGSDADAPGRPVARIARASAATLAGNVEQWIDSDETPVGAGNGQAAKLAQYAENADETWSDLEDGPAPAAAAAATARKASGASVTTPTTVTSTETATILDDPEATVSPDDLARLLEECLQDSALLLRAKSASRLATLAQVILAAPSDAVLRVPLRLAELWVRADAQLQQQWCALGMVPKLLAVCHNASLAPTRLAALTLLFHLCSSSDPAVVLAAVSAGAVGELALVMRASMQVLDSAPRDAPDVGAESVRTLFAAVHCVHAALTSQLLVFGPALAGQLRRPGVLAQLAAPLRRSEAPAVGNAPAFATLPDEWAMVRKRIAEVLAHVARAGGDSCRSALLGSPAVLDVLAALLSVDDGPPREPVLVHLALRTFGALADHPSGAAALQSRVQLVAKTCRVLRELQEMAVPPKIVQQQLSSGLQLLVALCRIDVRRQMLAARRGAGAVALATLQAGAASPLAAPAHELLCDLLRGAAATRTDRDVIAPAPALVDALLGYEGSDATAARLGEALAVLAGWLADDGRTVEPLLLRRGDFGAFAARLVRLAASAHLSAVADPLRTIVRLSPLLKSHLVASAPFVRAVINAAVPSGPQGPSSLAQSLSALRLLDALRGSALFPQALSVAGSAHLQQLALTTRNVMVKQLCLQILQ